MGILGKLLVIFNILAGAGFAYFAVQDWQGRQNITAVGLRYVLLLNGLPLECSEKFEPFPARVPATSDNFGDFSTKEIPFKVAMAGGKFTETVSPELLWVYFDTSAATGTAANGLLLSKTPVESQLAEVRRVLTVIKANVDKADGQKAKTDLLAIWLQYQPETYEERTEVLKLIEEQNVEELQKRLYGKFDRILTPSKLPNSAADTAKATADETSRRDRLTHLLIHLERYEGWQKRVMLVVGIKQYAKGVAAQVPRFRDMIVRVNQLILDDQDAFVKEYVELRTLAIQRTQEARERSETKRNKQEEKTKESDVVEQLTSQLNDLKAELAAVISTNNNLLVAESAIEKSLFELQRDVGLTLEDMFRKEDELAALEKKLYGARP